MSESVPDTELIDPTGRESVVELIPADTSASTDDWGLDEARFWPVTRLVAWALTLVLAIGVLVPTAMIQTRALDWFVLALPAAVATFAARGVFEALVVALGYESFVRRVGAAVAASLLAGAVMAGSCLIVGARWTLLIGIISAGFVTAILLTAGAARELEIRLRRSLRRVFLVGSLESRRDLERELSRRPDARLVGAMGSGQITSADRVVESVIATNTTVLILDVEAMRVPRLVEAAARLNLAGVRVRDLVSYYESEFKKVPLSEISPTWFLFDIASIHHQGTYRALRRGIDVIIAAVLLVVALPLLLIAALAIRLTSPGPVLFRQRRIGRGGTEFVLFKLRTMTEPVDGDDAAAWATAEEHRITAVGGLLRRSRLDELPQLWNVIRGDLALIGPRPEQVPIAAALGREITHYDARHCIRPGITGWAQVNLGYAGSREGALAKLQRDLYYVKHSSVRLDVLIAWLTLKAVLVGPDLNRYSADRSAVAAARGSDLPPPS